MIELIAAAVSGAVVGGGVVWRGMRRDTVRGWNALHALRSNCFIPDERGVKVRYSQASVERRVKAETLKEAMPLPPSPTV